MKNEPDIMREFEEAFGESPAVAVSAPGRVNLIGGHTDYNRGWVLPMAVERRIWAAARPTAGGIELSSTNMPERISLKTPVKRTSTWADYPIGVIWAHREGGCRIPGVKIHYHGNLPIGGGLASSAAIEVATALLLMKLCGLPLTGKQIARVCQLAENQFVGMRCGAMDQMVCALAKNGNALYLDCKDFSFEHVPLKLGNYKVVITDSGVKRELAQSAYNKRRKECEQAAASMGVKSLRDVDIEDLDKVENLPEPLNKRARHVVTENNRVQKAAEHLSKSNLEEFGNLITQSHASLRDDYEVSMPELDFLVDTLNKIDGVLGARLTGAGFGGCIVAIAHSNALPQIKKEVFEPYQKKFDKTPSFETTYPAEGGRIENGKL